MTTYYANGPITVDNVIDIDIQDDVYLNDKVLGAILQKVVGCYFDVSSGNSHCWRTVQDKEDEGVGFKIGLSAMIKGLTEYDYNQNISRVLDRLGDSTDFQSVYRLLRDYNEDYQDLIGPRSSEFLRYVVINRQKELKPLLVSKILINALK